MKQKNSKKTSKTSAKQKAKQKDNKISAFFKKNKKISVLILSILALAVIMGAGVYSSTKKERMQKEQEQQSKEEIKKNAKNSLLSKEMEKDIVFGNKNAPVTIIEYASLSCPHCAHFYNDVLDQIKKNYIDTNKVKFIYRDFPLNQSAMLASLISTCYAKNNHNDSEKYHKFIKVLFKSQDSWAFDKDFSEKLRSVVKTNGMTSAEFDVCANNKDLINEILQSRLQAEQELGIDSTPSFVINGEILGGYHDFGSFKKIIDQKLQPAK